MKLRNVFDPRENLSVTGTTTVDSSFRVKVTFLKVFSEAVVSTTYPTCLSQVLLPYAGRFRSSAYFSCVRDRKNPLAARERRCLMGYARALSYHRNFFTSRIIRGCESLKDGERVREIEFLLILKTLPPRCLRV